MASHAPPFGSLTDSSAVLANKRGALTGTQRDVLHLTSGLTFWYALGSAVVLVGIVVFALTPREEKWGRT